MMGCLPSPAREAVKQAALPEAATAPHDRTSALYDKPITSDLRDEGPASSRSTPAQGNLQPCSAPELQIWHFNY